MNEQALGNQKRKKKEKWNSTHLLWGKFLREPRKGLNHDTLRLPKSGGSSENVGNGQLGFGQLKRACSWTQGTKIGMSHQPLITQKKSWWLRNQHLIKRSLVPRETQEGELWRKVAEDLLAWQWGIYPFKENDKRWSSPKGGVRKGPSRSLRKRRLKASP